MLPARRKPLPPPRFDAAAIAEYARRGYGWTPLACDGLRARWLTAPDWVRGARLPEKGADGFVPLAGFLHPATQAVVGVRYSAAAFDFDPGDFLEVGDPRPASAATEYWLDGTLVAEHAGSAQGRLFAAAAHRRGRHVLVVTAEWPAAAARELTAAMTAFNAGLVIDGPPHAPVESYRTAAPPGLPVAFEHPERFAVRGSGSVASLRPEGGSGTELTVTVTSPGLDVERTLTSRAVDLHRRAGKPEQASVRMMTLEKLEHAAGPAAVRTFELGDGREATLAVVPLSSSVAVALESLYPGQRQSARDWMAARSTTRRLLASCRLR